LRAVVGKAMVVELFGMVAAIFRFEPVMTEKDGSPFAGLLRK